MTDFLFLANDNILKLKGLTDNETGAFVNDATVEVTLTDSAGVNVTGDTWPLAMGYIAASDGEYSAIMVNGLDLNAGEIYFGDIVAIRGGSRLDIRKHLEAEKRTA